eukprot:m.21573 g.21573  ORF g.21573 m.21573 type:complete len:512 (-) comp3934_c0_seq2:62-1597(-)
MGRKRAAAAAGGKAKRARLPARAVNPVALQLDVPSPDAAASSADAVFAGWMAAHSLKTNPSIALASTSVAGRGVVATAPITEQTTLFEIPRELLLGAATTGISAELQRHFSQLRDDSGAAGDLGWAALLTALLFEGRQRDSPWRPYLDVLPALGQFPLHPLMWPPEEAEALLARSPLLRGVQSDREAVENQFRVAVKSFVAKHPSLFPGDRSEEALLAEYRHWAAVVMAYSFTDDTTGSVVLAPFADMLNHVTGKTNANLYYADDSLQMAATEDIPAGAEIFNTYGELSNDGLLRKHGFVELENDNPHDHYEAFFDDLAEFAGQKFGGAIAERASWMMEGGFADPSFYISLPEAPAEGEQHRDGDGAQAPREHCIPRPLLYAARCLAAPDDLWRAFVESDPRPPFEDDGDSDAEWQNPEDEDDEDGAEAPAEAPASAIPSDSLPFEESEETQTRCTGLLVDFLQSCLAKVRGKSDLPDAIAADDPRRGFVQALDRGYERVLNAALSELGQH